MIARSRGQFVARVLANVPLCREHYRLVLAMDQFPATEPGQFVQLSCRDMDPPGAPERELDWRDDSRFDAEGAEWMKRSAYLRRPFSIAGRRDSDEGVELEFIHRVVGAGTDWLSRLKPADPVHLIGPLGNRFALPERESRALLVGGGVGIPPMLYLAGKLRDRPAVAFCGALTRDLLPLSIDPDAPVPGPDSADPHMNVIEFSRHGIPTIITTDDGSHGFRGFVTQALERYLEEVGSRRMADGRKNGAKGPEEFSSLPSAYRLLPAHGIPLPTIYTCGPEPMMKRVAEIAAKRGIECQIAVERAMACGMGTCQSCCIRVRKPNPAKPPLAGKEWCWRLACTDGPVFRGSELLW